MLVSELVMSAPRVCGLGISLSLSLSLSLSPSSLLSLTVFVGGLMSYVYVCVCRLVQRLLVTDGALCQSPVIIFDKYEFTTSYLSSYSQQFSW